MDALLHSKNIRRIPLLGKSMQRRLIQRVKETRAATKSATDPDISIVIRSKNNARQLEGLLQDIRAQDFSGQVEIIVVDTESQDESVTIAKKFGAKVVPITQAEFTYPKALNLGFKAATNPWVFSLVDHSALSNRSVFKVVTRWEADPAVAGAWAYLLPNANATIWERLAYVLWVWQALKSAHVTQKKEMSMGFFGANDLVVRRSVWKELGGFDERFAAGGEDYVLGRAIVTAGYQIIYDPTLSICHSHGLGLIDSVRQFRYWRRLAQPLAFDVTELQRYRSDL